MHILWIFLGLFGPIWAGVSLNLQKYSLTLTTQANIEKLFYIEEELITIFSVFLREEYFHHGYKDNMDSDFDEEGAHLHVHIKDLKKNKELLEDAKRVHRMLGSTFSKYLKHPINVYHLFKRMRKWKSAVEILFKSEPCQTWNMPELTSRLRNMNEGIPSEENFENVAYDLVILKHIYNLRTEDLFAGNIMNHTSLDPMSPGDIYDIARIAFKRDDYYYAITWAKYLTSMFTYYDIPTETYGFSMKNLFATLSSSYYQVGLYREATVAANMVLKIDPDSRLGKANAKFFETLVVDDEETKPLKRVPIGDKNRRRYEALCKGDIKKPAKFAMRYYCKYQKTAKMFIYEKMEILNFKPRILQFYDVFDEDEAEAVRHLGYEKLSKYSYGSEDFNTPFFTSIPHDKARKKWVQIVNKRLDSLPKISQQPYKRGQMEVRNVGVEGLFYDLKDSQKWILSYGGNTASMFAFLRNIDLGGEMVFLNNRVRVTPVQGSVVFFYPKKSHMMICPVGYDTEWLAVTSYFELKTPFYCRDTDA